MSNRKAKAQQSAAQAGRGQPTGRRGPGRGVFYAVAGVLILFVAIALAWPSEEPAGAQAAPVTNAERIDVVYFHRTERCQSCLWAGEMTRKTVETYFKDELASGRVTFREVDVQQSENAVLARQYGAAYSSLFINYTKDGHDHIVHANDAYPYIGDEARFSAVLRAKIAAGLEGDR
ncbi:MAG: nitrophenyl compound nitroreductase subunit ArsF family protein [Chloroflexota bacterium]